MAELYPQEPDPILDLLENLMGFWLEEQTEVYASDIDGNQTCSLGCFKDDVIARAYARQQPERRSEYCETRKIIVLTNGKIGFPVCKKPLVLNNEKEAAATREWALKLSPQERFLIGIEES